MASGEALLRGSAPRKRWGRTTRIIALVVLGVAAFVGVAVVRFWLSGGDESPQGLLQFAPPGPVDSQLTAALRPTAAGMPAGTGDTDRDQLRSLAGPPDAFSISFEQDDGGKSTRIVRYETWYYFELQTAFEFADGDLLSNMPIDDVAALAILPRQYDPAAFQRTTSWADVEKLVTDPAAFYRMDLPEAYGLKAWAYYGEQLMVAFDEEGLSIVETYPLEPGAKQ